MRAPEIKHFLSYLLMTAGTILVFLGARDVIESYFGQTAAARTFNSAPRIVQAKSVAKSPAIHTGDTIAKLSIPRLNTQLYIVEGDNERELRRGPGHMGGTVMPGARGNSVIAGHRDTHFRVLKDIRKGDDIVVETTRGQFLYRVSDTSIVPPSNTAALQPSSATTLHLITCYPFYYVGSAPKRFVVEARLAGVVTRLE
jgi:LPXTG-site transpeptidase (sortase) family protein